MPIIKSAIKRMKQAEVRRKSNRHFGSHMKSMIKWLLGLVEKGDMDQAKKILPQVTKSIDMAAKKGIIHGNNAARKKSRVQNAMNVGPVKKEEKPVKEKTPKAEVKKESKAKVSAAKSEKKGKAKKSAKKSA